MLEITRPKFRKSSNEKIQCPRCQKHFGSNIIEHLQMCCTGKH